MGYCMLYTQTRDLSNEEWGELIFMVCTILGQFKAEFEHDDPTFDGLEWSMNNERLRFNGKGAGWACQTFELLRRPISAQDEKSCQLRQITQQMFDVTKRMLDRSPERIASCMRSYNSGPAEAPWFANNVKTSALPYDKAAKAVLTALRARFPGSVITGDEEYSDIGEHVWSQAVEWAREALPSYAHVPNFGRAAPQRAWDRVRRYVFTVQPAFRACKLRAAERVYAQGGAAVADLRADFEGHAAAWSGAA